MHLLEPIPTVQKLIFIPRHSYSFVDLNLFNKETGEIKVFQDLPMLYKDGVATLEIEYDFLEGEMYHFEVSTNETLVYRGLIKIPTNKPNLLTDFEYV